MIVKKKVERVAAGCLAIPMLALIMQGASVSAPYMQPSPYIHTEPMQHAAVIKTQAAADQLLSQGAIRGIDVSKYQGTIDWSKVAGSNVEFAFIRASYGATEDPYFVFNAQQAHKNNIYVGAYHYATFQNRAEMQAEAQYFLNLVKKVNITYPLVLDLESPRHTTIPSSTLTSLVTEFMDILQAEGYSVMLYSYSNFIHSHLNIDQLKDYDLWIANYQERPNGAKHQIWQHTASGSINGINGPVDMNVAYTHMVANGGKRRGNINQTQTGSIAETLNNRYNTDLALDDLDQSVMNHAIATSLQREISKQWKIELRTTGSIGTDELDLLSEINWNANTQGNIVYLLQAKLFYAGYYTGSPTSQFDQETTNAVTAFQQANSLPKSGKFDYQTLKKLLA